MKNIKRNEPLVTIVTVTYNAAATIGRTMKSVSEQTARDYEHIIMDGVSTDKTLKIVDENKTSRTVVFSSFDQGIYDAMNKAMGHSRGRYLLFLNAGDTFADAETLQRFIDAINKEEPDIIYGQTVSVDKQGKIIGQRHLIAPETLTTDSFKTGMTVCHQAFMVRRDIAPLYDLEYKLSADYEWCIICLQNSKKNVYLGNEPVIHYLNEGMTTKNHSASLNERFKIMCKYYGTIPTVLRHFNFATRYLKRRNNASNIQ